MECRLCERPKPVPVLDLGSSPVADRLLREDQLQQPPLRFPLELVVCRGCGLAQLTLSLEPELLFGEEYPYLSSVSQAVVDNARDNVDEVLTRLQLGVDDLVVEVASNDGYLLQNFLQREVRVLGIDPAAPPAARAQALGVPTLKEFFGLELARQLRRERGAARLIFANNVLAHVRDLNDFVAGLAHLLHPEGLLRVEVPYVVDLVEGLEFDTIYHQHLCYFSVVVLQRLFAKHGLSLCDLERLPIHGGSLRLTVAHQGSPSNRVVELLRSEADQSVNDPNYYLLFAGRVTELVQGLKRHLTRLKNEGYRLAAYGAAAKATTLLHCADIDNRLLDYVVDRNTFKHGRYLDGPQLLIRPVAHLLQDKPDFVLLLAWNHAVEILAQQREFRDAGGRFIVPLPQLETL